MVVKSGREREAKLIRQANRAVAVGRLMLGEFDNWHDFLHADILDLENLPRRNLKSGSADVKNRLSAEIKKFCAQNFRGMDGNKLSELYEEIKAYRGMELPLSEFEKRFAPLQPKVLAGRPKHLTICISLWGLQFKFPEEDIAKDLAEAIRLVSEAHTGLKEYATKPHHQLLSNRSQVSALTREKSFAARTVVICCFNLIESYLNGLAWDHVQTFGTANLSNQKKKLLEDTASVTIRDKLLKYPEILTGQKLWDESDQELEGFISTVKPYRDSLVHPSPFSAPVKFGGYDKLRLFYRVDHDTSVLTTNLLVNLLKRIHQHVYGEKQTLPDWIIDLEAKVKEYSLE